MKQNLIRAAGALALLLTALTASAHGLTIIDPWIRAAPPNAPALGAFMVLQNQSDTDFSIVGARTLLDVDRVELHRTMMQEGVMKMVPQTLIPVAAKSKTVLEPGSWHVMLIGPKKVPKAGETVQLTLVLSDGTEQQVEAIVRKGEMKMKGHEHKMQSD